MIEFLVDEWEFFTFWSIVVIIACLALWLVWVRLKWESESDDAPIAGIGVVALLVVAVIGVPGVIRIAFTAALIVFCFRFFGSAAKDDQE